MGIGNAMNIGVQGLSAQSQAVQSTSNNIANAQTTGYKRERTSFEALATQGRGQGVNALYNKEIAEQGALETTGRTTDFAIDGRGFMVVGDQPGDETMNLTKAGSFTPDAEGFLRNDQGKYLKGVSLRNVKEGEPEPALNPQNMEAVNVRGINYQAQPTQNITFKGNLPAMDTTHGLDLSGRAKVEGLQAGDSGTISLNSSGQDGQEIAVKYVNTAGTEKTANITLRPSGSAGGANEVAIGSDPSGTAANIASHLNSNVFTVGNSASFISVNQSNSDLEFDLGAASGSEEIRAIETDSPLGDVSTEYTTNVSYVDNEGNSRELALRWKNPQEIQGGAVEGQSYQLEIADVGPNGSTVLGEAQVDFGDEHDNAAIGALKGIQKLSGDDITVQSDQGNIQLNAAKNTQINLDLGQPIGPESNGFNGVTMLDKQYAVTQAKSDGAAFSTVDRMNLTEDGRLQAVFKNGKSQDIYKIPVATVPSPDNLENMGEQAFRPGEDSGGMTLKEPGNNAGEFVGGSLEQSNVDMAAELTKLIVEQRSYSANAKSVQTADSMYQRTIQIKR